MCLCVCGRVFRGGARRSARKRLLCRPSGTGTSSLNRLPTFMEPLPPLHVHLNLGEPLTTNRTVMTLGNSGSTGTACGLPDARRSAPFPGGLQGGHTGSDGGTCTFCQAGPPSRTCSSLQSPSFCSLSSSDQSVKQIVLLTGLKLESLNLI